MGIAPLRFDRRHRCRWPHPRATRSVGDLPRAAVPRPRAAHRGRRGRARGSVDRRPAVEAQPARLRVDARRDGRARPARHGPRPRAHVPAPGALRVDGSEGAPRPARPRGHRRRRALHDDRLDLGGRGRRPRDQPGLHPRLQPLDLRLLPRRAPPGADRAPLALRSRSPPRRSWSERWPTAPAARTSRRSPTTPSRSATPTTMSSSPLRKTSTCPSRSTPRSSRSGRRASAWARGST